MFIKRLVLILLFLLAPIAALASSDAAHPVSPEQALQMLSEGNLRFSLGQSTHPNTSFSRRLVTTTDGQAPFATVIACSDSRVPVEILFDQGVGDLFVIKVAGNVADTDEIGSAEYGVDHLGTPVLMVLGHTYCGAVTAVTTGAEVHGSIPKLVDNIVPAVEKAKHEHPGAEQAELINAAIEANVWQSVDDIMTKSHAIAERAAAGKVVVVGAIYDILTGKVRIIERAEAAPAAAHAAPEAHAEAAATGKETAAHDDKAPAEKHAEPAKAEKKAEEHAAPAAKDAAHDEKAAAHAEEGSSGGGFGFFSFVIFVLLLIGAVFILDKKVLNPEEK
ncbi:carbonic anhydrase [Desulfomicrobium salsuginis]